MKKIGDIIIQNPKSKIKIRDVEKGKFIFFRSGKNTLFHNKKIIDGENIFLSTGGTANVHYFSGDAAYSTDVFCITTDPSIYNTRYLYYKILSMIEVINNDMFKGATIKHLQKNEFKNIEFNIQSIHEQKRIVEKLDTCMEQIDKAIKNVEQNIQNAEDLFQGQLNEIFNKFDKSLLANLAQLADIISGQSPKSSYYNSDKKGLPFYQGKKLFNNKFISKPNTWTSHTTKVSISGDILMSVRAPVGDININNVGEICIGRGLAAIRPNELLNREFLFYFLVYFKDKLSFNIGATINSINRKQISQIGVPKIELHEQSKIAENINSFEKNLYQVTKNYENEILALNDLKQSILEKAFNGEL